jgi:2-oxoglutarate-dependent dioxygenase
MLTDAQLQTFRLTGHVTVPAVFTMGDIAAAIADIDSWSSEFLSQLPDDRQDWYLEQHGSVGKRLRKLDNPVFHRVVFRQMAQQSQLVACVQQLIGEHVSVFFSQVFMKPPEGGGPKPIHQDNFYFGPDDSDATLTVWIAIDNATVENGCLFYGDGSNKGDVMEHVAPPDQPFNLQIPLTNTQMYGMKAAPVTSGGVSFHHGNTLHQSAANTSQRSRRAIAMHYLRNSARLIKPALAYDASMVVRIT